MYKDYPAAYQVSKGSALQVDVAFYERIRERKETTFVKVPPRLTRQPHALLTRP